ncbi:multidrug effflux MFS transporter [Phaeobacter sp. QD34_3]|uniref:multidrug effflux MFS transporter n=1 Tax=unclassified Phaeobacter TaxID=2621772 RepID=UPI00237F2BDE|nr:MULTISPECIES: multidrug effflux MFS transporter [unclassified Phaeobacter]MDE4134125.1 multidrug effflux MFS transporter [Phaeobacter sp. QD34_3]MDE4137952.1 multidrug effflux MFS transporter [Phaeobacter sp. QD34_24]
MRPAQTAPHIVTLIFGTALSVLSLNMFLPSLARIGEDFQADYGLVNLSIAGYLAISAVLQLVMGPLSDRFGRRPVMLLSIAIFVAASIGCALAQSIWVFLGFRLAQGAVVAGQVVSRAAIRDMHSAQEAASKMGYVSMAMALAPMLGPMLGGFLEMAFGWRAGFVLYTVLGLGMLALAWGDWGETNGNRSATFGAQMRTYPELLASRRFWGYSLCVAFSIGGFFAFITGAPLVAAAWFDLSPAMVGLGIGIITGGFMLGNFITGRVAGRVPLLTLIIAGRISATLGPLAGLILFALGQGSVPVFFGSAILVGFGNGLTIANASAGLMSVRPHLAGSASGLSGALSVALGAVITSLTGALVEPHLAPFAVLGIILCSSIMALASALYVRWVDRCDPLPEAG